jgi:hypothetical protein
VIGSLLKDRTEVSSSGSEQAVSAAAAPQFPHDGVAALYFHGETRCPTCRKIEATAEEAITTGFSEELQRGTMIWQVVNCAVPADRHYVEDFQLYAPTVVLVKMRNGEQVEWKNLTRVWELIGDRTAFLDYVQGEVRSYLTEGTDE